MRALPFLLSCVSLGSVTPGDPRKEGEVWLTKAAVRAGFHFSSRAEHLLWGRDPVTGRWEALAVLSPRPGSGKGQLVRLFRIKEQWQFQHVRFIPFNEIQDWSIWATPAEDLADMGGCPPLLHDQNPKLYATPIEFHLQAGEDGGIEAIAKLFHPKLGLATVINSIQDDRDQRAPKGQTWGTHARGESVDLPLSAFYEGVKELDRWRGRVWFRLDGELYAICQEDWKAPWPQIKPKDPGSD